MGTLNQRIKTLEKQIKLLQNKINNLSANIEEKPVLPYSKVGGIRDRSQISPAGMIAGTDGGILPWNDAELKFPPYGQKPNNPKKGYNKHGHSKYAGGALDINTLELVEYDVDWETSFDYNKHCQQFWLTLPPIAKADVIDNNGNVTGQVEKIGLLDLAFDPQSQKWSASAFEIDIKKCYFVERDENGDIVNDENGNPKRSPLYNEDNTKNNITWDKNAQCWRLFATYAE